ncbi:hypothetical protein EVAR_16040_1 [Eumeta japonica]|uniref:Uncharacterized protein n=1 Tax=Eumeta variegata TaxID=151549 RepID=A0A4C1VW56_EUMVA|nr:hypothetical protein EVAR_16040_1 [Eumeta japonica]
MKASQWRKKGKRERRRKGPEALNLRITSIAGNSEGQSFDIMNEELASGVATATARAERTIWATPGRGARPLMTGRARVSGPGLIQCKSDDVDLGSYRGESLLNEFLLLVYMRCPSLMMRTFPSSHRGISLSHRSWTLSSPSYHRQHNRVNAELISSKLFNLKQENFTEAKTFPLRGPAGAARLPNGRGLSVSLSQPIDATAHPVINNNNRCKDNANCSFHS